MRQARITIEESITGYTTSGVPSTEYKPITDAFATVKVKESERTEEVEQSQQTNLQTYYFQTWATQLTARVKPDNTILMEGERFAILSVQGIPAVRPRFMKFTAEKRQDLLLPNPVDE